MRQEPERIAPPSEEEVYAEHRAALEATLFVPSEAASSIVLELREGVLRSVRG